MRDLMETRAQVEAERAVAIAARREVKNMSNQNRSLREALQQRVAQDDVLDRAHQQKTPIPTIGGVPTPGPALTADPATGLAGTFVPPYLTLGSLTRPTHSNTSTDPQVIYLNSPLLPGHLGAVPIPQPTADMAGTSGPNTTTAANIPPLDINTRLLLQMNEAIASLQARVESSENRTGWQPITAGFQGKTGRFTARIQAEKRPPEAKPLKIEKYNGTRDPYHHLEVFESILHGTRYTDAMACHAFEETLTDEALRWFLNLPTNSIDSFQELGDKFLRRFILCGGGYRTTPDLFRLKQRPNERLRDFVRRWQNQATQCRSFDPVLAASAFKQAIQPGYFLLQINTNPPATYDDLLDAATAFA
ncbi:uncharacterized protein LOC133729116 [Rosa rugosa]|uniref:uncharacterized protein LOC133729116 n=1 Tax=Rosa rugosa TaxID=74645 RepID=UPI002B416909|nr:uncharacterized protein LOC133729116 [Rosa rugosa]